MKSNRHASALVLVLAGALLAGCTALPTAPDATQQQAARKEAGGLGYGSGNRPDGLGYGSGNRYDESTAAVAGGLGYGSGN